MSKSLANLVAYFARGVTAYMGEKRRMSTYARASEILAPIISVETDQGALQVYCPTARALHDPQNFGTDEPETISWIRDIVAQDHVIWDIGANIGLYSLYAAQFLQLKVFAFEPSAASFSVLMRNIELNQFGQRIDAFCMALDEKSHIDYLHMASSEAGHSMHAFGQLQTVEGEITPAFSQSVMGFSIDEFRRTFDLAPPDHIKIDVDGIEPKILRGARETLAHVKSVLIEIDGTNKGSVGEEVIAFLTGIGFRAQPSSDKARNKLFLRSEVS